jgi:hypothetical protein
LVFIQISFWNSLLMNLCALAFSVMLLYNVQPEV